MNEIETLKLAALACGYTVSRISDDGKSLLLEGVQEPWNPLLDSDKGLADCYRMETLLKIGVEELNGNWKSYTKHGVIKQSNNRQDASVICAAAIGKSIVQKNNFLKKMAEFKEQK